MASPEKNRCPVCDTVLTLQDVKGGKGFVCPCGDSSEVYPIIVGKPERWKGLPGIKVQCPFCGKIHHHSDQPVPALRRSHCGMPSQEGEALRKLLEKYPKHYEGGTYYLTLEEI